jgi:hypothetical protein
MSFPPNKVTSDAFNSAGSMVTPADIKTRYLFGIDLTDQDGNELPKEVFEHAINTAVSFLEHKLDIVILKRGFEEKYDYRQVDYTNFNFIQLKKRPAIEVTEIKAKFPNNVDLVTYPEQWFVLEKEAAQIQLSPVEGTFSGLVVTSGGSYVPLLYGTKDYWPHLFQIKYVAGFEHDCIPTVINDMIGMQAAIRLFEILGDIVLGPGVTSESVGMDGASVSKQTGGGAKNNVFSARIDSYRTQMKDYIETVRKYYNGFAFTVA